MTTKTKGRKSSAAKPAAKDSIGGTYVYDKTLGKVVKVSDRVPKVASKASGGLPSGDTGPCGRAMSECGGGGCGMG